MLKKKDLLVGELKGLMGLAEATCSHVRYNLASDNVMDVLQTTTELRKILNHIDSKLELYQAKNTKDKDE